MKYINKTIKESISRKVVSGRKIIYYSNRDIFSKIAKQYLEVKKLKNVSFEKEETNSDFDVYKLKGIAGSVVIELTNKTTLKEDVVKFKLEIYEI